MGWSWPLPQLLVLGIALTATQVRADVYLKDVSSDHPIVLDQDTDYSLQNVNVAGLHDAAAVTLTGRINSVTISNSTFGNIRSGENGKAAALECAGAAVGSVTASDSVFFDSENQLLSLRDGSFSVVSFTRCTFRTSPQFLKELYAASPWRSCPPVTEFYNIDRLELFDNDFANTMVIIHPSVKKVIIRGEIPGLQIEDKTATQVLCLPAANEPQPQFSLVSFLYGLLTAFE